ncbi:ORF4 [Giant panda anellovirus]|uniref:ORF4 n=1 Tax=Giant panda anellovirus TaxID=2016460 RepID=A0A220IGJ1_9VIRU|nr:ORF4 [Giant panda anellovirus]ASH99105.1 ORF4 [Giant panda anellovirus]
MAGPKRSFKNNRHSGSRYAPYLTASSVTVVTGSTIFLNTREGDRNAYKVSKEEIQAKACLSLQKTEKVAQIPPTVQEKVAPEETSGKIPLPDTTSETKNNSM